MLNQIPELSAATGADLELMAVGAPCDAAPVQHSHSTLPSVGQHGLPHGMQCFDCCMQ